MRFLYPQLLWLLLLLPLLAVLHGRRGAAPSLSFSSLSLAAALAGARKTRPGFFLLLPRLAVVALLILALAGPQQGNSTTEITASGIDIILAVDVSGSMEAMDFTLDGKPANRLEAVKKVVDRFIDGRPGDRIGLVAFAGKPYLMSPPTLDHQWLRQRLEALNLDMAEDGTAIGSAIGSGINHLRDQDSKSRLLILLTDGINNSGSISPLNAAEAAEAMGIKIYTIGAGTRGEAPLPVVDPFGRRKLVRARVDIDEETLTAVAEKTGAVYFRATDTASLEKIYKDIDKMETTRRTIEAFQLHRDLFPYLVAAALLALAFELYLNRRRLP